MTSLQNKLLAKNTAWLIIAEFVSRIIVFVAVVWLTNYLGDHQYGELVYAFAIANILVIIADFGLTTYLVKDLARDLSKTKKYINNLFGIKIILMLVTLFLIIIACYILGNVNIQLALIGGSAIILQNARMFIEGFFRAHQKMYLEAYTKTIAGTILAITLLVFVKLELSIEMIATGYLLAASLAISITLYILYKKISAFTLKFSWAKTRFFLYAAWPFAVTIAINYIFNYMDTAMLGFLNQTKAVGWYSAAYKPIFFLTAIAGMVINAFFPVISRQFKIARHLLNNTVTQLFRINMLIAVPMAIGGSLIAYKLIALLYTSEFEPASLAFKILIWSTALIYIWSVFGNSLQACDEQKTYMKGFVWGAIINIVLNFSLIPWFSLYGAASATLFTQLFLVLFMYFKFKKIENIKLFNSIWKPLIAGIIMGLVIYLLNNMAIWWLVVIGIITYVIIIILIRGVNKNDILLLKSIWQK